MMTKEKEETELIYIDEKMNCLLFRYCRLIVTKMYTYSVCARLIYRLLQTSLLHA